MECENAVVFDNVVPNGDVIITVKTYIDNELFSLTPYVMKREEVEKMFKKWKEVIIYEKRK